MRRALVIGGTGPTGPGIVTGLLDAGYDLTILHRGTHEASLPDDVVHLHADPHFFESLTSALAGLSFDLVVSTYGRARLLPEALIGVAQRLVVIGGATYTHGTARPAKEDSERVIRPSLFAKVVETEQVLFDAHARGDLAITLLRFPQVYGPRAVGPTDWSIIRRIRDGRERIPVLEGGLLLRTRAFAGNAAHAVVVACESDRSVGEVYNATDSFTMSDADRVRAYASLMGATVELVSVPSRIRVPDYYPGTSRDARVPQASPNPISHELISNEKIRNELGYEDVVGFEAAMDATFRWYSARPLPPGGEAETRLGDDFDYAAEDQLLTAVLAGDQRVAEAVPAAGSWRHPYDHPEDPSSPADSQPR